MADMKRLGLMWSQQSLLITVNSRLEVAMGW